MNSWEELGKSRVSLTCEQEENNKINQPHSQPPKRPPVTKNIRKLYHPLYNHPKQHSQTQPRSHLAHKTTHTTTYLPRNPNPYPKLHQKNPPYTGIPNPPSQYIKP